MAQVMTSALALLGGPRTVAADPGDIFTWPIITPEIEAAVLEVLRRGAMSGTDVTVQFEREFADWHGTEFGLAHNTGTAALHSAMFGLGIGEGDEIICPSVTYWASALPVYSLGGTVVFADIDPNSLCIEPTDIERWITPRTKAIVVVHYLGHPADMDPIMGIARQYNLKVIEDCSHAHGALYKGKLVGTIGDVGAFSLMSGKSFAIGEGGILITNDRRVYERAIAFGHYERHKSLTEEDLVSGAGLPLGGYKYRMHQLSSAVGREQVKKYPSEMAEIDRAMNYFWDLLEGVPGIRAHRPPKDSGLTMGGWYSPVGLYRPEELSGLSVTRFCQALAAEGVPTRPGLNKTLHLHPVFTDLDIYDDGKPTRVANLPDGATISQPMGTLPVAESIQGRVFGVPWFKKHYPDVIQEHANAIKKVIERHEDLLADDPGNPATAGNWGMTQRAGAS